MDNTRLPNMVIISSERNWMEQAAVDQLKKVATLPGVIKAVGMPDLHPGKTPVGAAVITENVIYPHLIGNDIGCGVALFMTDIKVRKMKLERWVKRLEDIESVQDIDIADLARDAGLEMDSSLGTIGGGNHFAELQKIEKILDSEVCEQLGIEKEYVMLLVHSGSRGLGQAILDESIKNHQAQNGLVNRSKAACDYLEKHDHAVRWAVVNRELIAYRLLDALNVNTRTVKIIDSTHNFISQKEAGNGQLLIHRKGAAPADNGAVAIPGSRGTLTYLVVPTADTKVSGYSVAHGAGRKWERSICKGRLESKYTKETIKSTKLKGRTVCSDSKLLFEEASEAYKDIDIVIDDLVSAGLVKIIATLRPVLTYKG